MTDYVKTTNFTAKDSLPSGNANKKVKGSEFDTEFNAIATAISSKANSASPTFTGTPAAPTAAVNTNTTQIATTAFVVAQIADDAPAKDGTGATGTWGISISGNAATASNGGVTSVNSATGAVTVATAPFDDATAIIKGSADATKLVRFEVDGITTGTTRVLTVPDADLTLVGTATTQTLTNKTFTGYTETVYTLSGTDINPANGTVQTKTLSGNTTFTESLADGQSVVLMLNPSTYTTTWPTTTWINSTGNGSAPTLEASSMNVVVLWQVGGTLYGNWIGSA